MKVSILIPNYNHGKYLRKSIESALFQSYQDLEIIFVDDASTDDSCVIAEEYALKDNRVKITKRSENGGFPVALKQCFGLSTGEIIFCLASDDSIFANTFIELAVKRFTEHPSIGLVWARTALIYDDGQPFTILGESEKLLFDSGSEFLCGFLRRENFVAGYSAVFKRTCLEAIGGFPFELGPQADYFANHAVPSVFGGAFIPQVMTHSLVFRDGSNYSNNVSAQDKVYRHCEFEKRMRALNVIGVDPSLWLSWRKQLIHDIATNSQEWAHEHFNKEIKC